MLKYRRADAVAYARKWALSHNPDYYNFSGLGGDCANFASQCLHAGGCRMNNEPVFGWYYYSLQNRSPAWSSVAYLYRFLTQNKSTGPFAQETELSAMQPGDIIQIATNLPEFHHTLVVTEIGAQPTYETTRICTHSYDSLDRPLASYAIRRIRFLHIAGIRA